MNFTREPIIETIVAPREGYRLLIRSSKHRTGDEFLVDAVEMVSFGVALFFRSLEHPKPFLLPVSDYEILEIKEARLGLKTAQPEKNMKISGGARPKEGGEEPKEQQSGENRKERRHKRRRHGGDEKKEHTRESRGEEAQEESPHVQPSKGVGLVPPPSSLVSEKLSRVHEEKNHPEEQGMGDTSTLQRSAIEMASSESSFPGFPNVEDPLIP